ncbi:cysteine-rich and transmembrane domain-containing protein 1 [Neoarius graeffei]|uniref:cysteine-rich and transmembrane domain-containing protein 1 n=1 Tax=Neoarius graeffei TaxID=443677 RepID=UPI00298D47D1|nr:cysteine-rich and transmembrane domain-containing protein 1 [Neoarius graeffei]XP_060791197.1 cysteine-rich and transmembrane domain-containing protein 1 [Neoarius graeffei]
MSFENPPPYAGPGAPVPGYPPANAPGYPPQGYPPQGYPAQPGPYPNYPAAPPGPYPGQPGYQGYPVPPQPGYGGPVYGEAPKNTVYVVEQGRRDDSGDQACLTACWTALCCCCLWDMLT